MANVTGPCRTLAGSYHPVPTGQMCDDHDDRIAVKRIQGETDSFGSEQYDVCQECYDAYLAYKNSPEAEEEKHGCCDWCKSHATDLRDRRDYEEGSCGPVYRVCGACVTREHDAIHDEFESRDDDWDEDYDDFDGHDDLGDDWGPDDWGPDDHDTCGDDGTSRRRSSGS